MARQFAITLCAAVCLITGAFGAQAQDAPPASEESAPAQADNALWQQPQDAAPLMRPAYDDHTAAPVVEEAAVVVDVPKEIRSPPSGRAKRMPTDVLGHWPLLIVGFGVVLSFFAAFAHGARM